MLMGKRCESLHDLEDTIGYHFAGDLTTLQDNTAWPEDLHDAFHDGLEEGMESDVCRATSHGHVHGIIPSGLFAHIHQVACAWEEVLPKLVKADSHHPARTAKHSMEGRGQELRMVE